MQRIGGKVDLASRKSLRILAGLGLLCASLPMVARGQGTFTFLADSMLGSANSAATHPWTVLVESCGQTITHTMGVSCIQD